MRVRVIPDWSTETIIMEVSADTLRGAMMMVRAEGFLQGIVEDLSCDGEVVELGIFSHRIRALSAAS